MDGGKLSTLVVKATKKWTKQRKAEERSNASKANRAAVFNRSYRETIKDIANEVMRDAYMKASANGTLPAHARQIMYAARPFILERYHKPLAQRFDQYFTQNLLPAYIRRNRDETSEWNVVFDARGHFFEPHTGIEIPLGTKGVRSYLRKIDRHTVRPLGEADDNRISRYPTIGPKNRVSAILFLEKEGFNDILTAARIPERYDIAVMSTKGLSNTAARELNDRLCSEFKVPLLVLHDFDKAGFSILSTLQKSNHRYRYKGTMNVIDLGIRLEDVEEYDLVSEPVYYQGASDPTDNLLENGASDEEVEFLWHRDGSGERVELNAFTSDQFTRFVESKLEEHGIQKVIPDRETMEDAYRRALVSREFQKRKEEILKQAASVTESAPIPPDLKDRIEAAMKDTPTLSWDAAMARLLTSRTQ